MLDPFPLGAPALLSKAIQPLANALSLHTLPLHAHEIAFAFALYHSINKHISPFLSSRLFPRAYASFNARTRINWDIHVVSLVQSSLINGLALWVMREEWEQRSEMGWRERVFGYTGGTGLIQAFAAGYFLWDLMVSTLHYEIFGFGTLAHAISALSVYLLGFRPFVNFYAPNFILYELSSPFLNFHWFFDKLNMTGSTPQFINGIILLSSFFCCRLVWGVWQSIVVIHDVYRAFISGRITTDFSSPVPPNVPIPADATGVMRFANDAQVPVWLCASYLAANCTLNILNVYWFKVMVDALRKRFDPPLGTKKKVEKSKEEKPEVLLAGGVDADGRTSVEVLATEVRSRRAVEVAS